jgi:WXG100 family type VII secretion target
MADEIRVDYDAMEEISSKFATLEDAIATMLSDVRTKMEDLRADGWQGRGSDKFYDEMTSEVIPAVERLRDAMGEANMVCKQTVEVVREAEQNARGLFV